jgi:hypothetical protein
MSLALLTLVLARAHQPTPQERLELEFDHETAELTERLVGRIMSAIDISTESVRPEKLQRQIERAGYEVQVRGRCVCVEGPDGAPGCCVCG